MLEAIAARLGWLGVVLTDHQLIADVSAGYDAVIIGADKWAQIMDPVWYQSAEARDAAVARLPRILVAPRPPFPLWESRCWTWRRPTPRSAQRRSGPGGVSGWRPKPPPSTTKAGPGPIRPATPGGSRQRRDLLDSGRYPAPSCVRTGPLGRVSDVAELWIAAGCLVAAQVVGIYGLVTRKADVVFSIFMIVLVVVSLGLGAFGAYRQLG